MRKLLITKIVPLPGSITAHAVEDVSTMNARERRQAYVALAMCATEYGICLAALMHGDWLGLYLTACYTMRETRGGERYMALLFAWRAKKLEASEKELERL